ncbi:MAG: hypothetical protein O2819_03345 [Planctomycetota bacterium]|nr:hypothetical protein [Planctomycetota bacterium]
MEHHCPILGRHTQTAPTPYSRGEWSLVRCTETGLVFLPDPPAYEQLEEQFAWEQTSVAERRRRIRDEPVLARLSSAYKRVRLSIFRSRNKMADLALSAASRRRWPATEALQVVDLGCAECKLLASTHARCGDAGRSCVPIGIEVSRQLARDGDQRMRALGGRVICDSAISGVSGLPAGSIHLVLMSSFLELLRALRLALRPDGAVILKVPNFDCLNRRIRGGKWCGFRYPDHVNYFTPSTLARLASEAGYCVARQRLSDRLPTSDNMYAVLEPR